MAEGQERVVEVLADSFGRMTFKRSDGSTICKGSMGEPGPTGPLGSQFLDNFDRPDSGPPLGGLWLDGGNQPKLGFKIANEQLANPKQNNGGVANWCAATWKEEISGPQEVWVDVPTLATDSYPQINLYLCLQGLNSKEPGQSASGYEFYGQAGNFQVYNFPDYSVYFSISGLTIAAGDGFGFSIDKDGNLTAWHKPVGGKWTSVGSKKDPNPYTHGYISVEASGNWVLDNIGGGKIA